MMSYVWQNYGGFIASAAAVAVVAAACWLVCRRIAAALTLAAPMAITMPWAVSAGHVDASGLFPLTASAALLVWLAGDRPKAESPRGSLAGYAVAAFLATLAVVLTPQALGILAAMAAYCVTRDGFRKSLPRTAAVFFFPLVYLALTLVRSALWEGRASDPGWWFEMTVGQGWAAPAAYVPGQGSPAGRLLYMFFYVPLFATLAAVAWPRRRDWWFGPVFFWGAALVAGNLFIARVFDPRASLTLQMGLTVPLGLSLFAAPSSPERRDGSKPFAAPAST